MAVAIPLLLLRRNAFLLPFDFGTGRQIEIGAAAVVLLSCSPCNCLAPTTILQFGSAVFAGLGIFAVISGVQLLRCAFWQPGPQEIRASLPARLNAHGPRIVWIVFDELAYRQTLGKRPADLNLPNFDSFRDTSTLYTDVLPAGMKAAIALPALLLGNQAGLSAMAGNDGDCERRSFLAHLDMARRSARMGAGRPTGFARHFRSSPAGAGPFTGTVVVTGHSGDTLPAASTARSDR